MAVLTVHAACATELQCSRGGSCSNQTAIGRCASPSSPRLCCGSDWTACYCDCVADSHRGSLLVLHSLECALTLPQQDPLLVVVLGPTASGKTALALAIAHQFQGEIVNCDSVAMYREFEIGTAKPSREERVEVPHHLIDCADPTAAVTAGEYAREARKVLSEIAERKHLPIVSGGTGLYLRALLEGLFAGPQRSDELRDRLRERAAESGGERLHRILRRLDKTASERIHANDVPKLIRAIEVCLATRQPMTELWKEGREPLRGFRILRIGLNPNREALYRRINDRAAEMFRNGLISETECLWKRYSDSARPLQSLGYKQAMQYLRGELTQNQALEAAQQAHRNYAKRQMTWFRREPDVLWLAGFGHDSGIQAEALALVRQRITASA